MRSLFLLLAAAAVSAEVTLLPLLSYSSGSGFLFGAAMEAVLDGRPGGEFSAMAYGTTRGGQFQSIGVRIPGEEDTWFLEGRHDQQLDHDFFGWGNGGDPDSSLEYDRETDLLRLGRVQWIGSLETTAGIEVRHSSAFDLEDGPLWDTAPSLITGSEWSAGPSLDLKLTRCPVPIRGYAHIGFDWQRGRDFDYCRAELERVAYLFLPRGNYLALRYDIAWHDGVEQTPFPFQPSLGPDQLLRGYSDDRFTGPWTSVANIEIRRPLFSFMLDPHTMKPVFLIGMALYSDAGQAAGSFDGFRWDRWHPDAGVGISLTFRQVSLRLDMTVLSPEGFKLDLSIASEDF